ncbi:MAG: reverse transcriptase family protein [Deltaproteobacteria bacterium]
MGLFDWLRRLLGGDGFEQPPATPVRPAAGRPIARPRRPKVRLVPLRTAQTAARGGREGRAPEVPARAPRPYRFARRNPRNGCWLDLSRDQDDARLEQFELPRFRIPEELAGWLEVPCGRLAWLIHRFEDGERPADERAAHYVYRWIAKRSGGQRLIEAPKPLLKQVQRKIVAEILTRVPVHPAAHGFVAGKSIRTNARPHVGQRVVVKFDLENFYPSVGYGRVVAIFRSLGYSREAAIWLARLTTAVVPDDCLRPDPGAPAVAPYRRRRLPQGAPSSPALANLSAFSLDLRLSGLARTFGAQYTRYADDLTFSGDQRFLKSLAVFLPLVRQIVRSEKFRLNRRKRKVIRNSQRQTVTGVVVNTRPNVCRRDYDTVKAILTNCVRRGPSTQNHERHEKFATHLLGRIAHVAQLNPARGAKLRALYAQIDWNR